MVSVYYRYMVSAYCRYIVSVCPLFSEIHQVWLSLSPFLLELQGLSIYVYWYQNVYLLKHPNLHAHSQTSKQSDCWQSKSKHLSVWMPLCGSPPGDQAFDGSCQHVTKRAAGQWQREACGRMLKNCLISAGDALLYSLQHPPVQLRVWPELQGCRWSSWYVGIALCVCEETV